MAQLRATRGRWTSSRRVVNLNEDKPTVVGSTRERVDRALYLAVDQVNRQLPREKRLTHSLEVPLVGAGARLDSLGLLNFLALTEQAVEEEFGRPLSLIDDDAVSEGAPLESIQALSEFIVARLQEASDAR